MASIPGARLNITGASGSSGLLGPKNAWLTYVLPRGAYASQDSTGSLITFDSAAAAARFAVNNWIQVGLSPANIRKVSAVGGNSLSVSGAAVTVTTNDRVYLIGNTQPSVVGGSATYIIPQSLIYQRDDDTSTRYTNSKVTSNADGLIQFFAGPNFYDCIIQDGNQANQGSVIDLPLGAVEGISTTMPSVFGATVTINANVGVTGTVVFGQTVTFNGNITGAAANITLIGSLIATANITAGASLVGVNTTITGLLDAQDRAKFGSTATFNQNIGVTGTATFGATTTFTKTILHNRISDSQALTFDSTGVSLSASWGTGATVSASTSGTDQHGGIAVTSGSGSVGSSAVATLTFRTAYGSPGPDIVVSRTHAGDSFSTPVSVSAVGTTSVSFKFMGTPGLSTPYAWTFMAFGKSG